MGGAYVGAHVSKNLSEEAKTNVTAMVGFGFVAAKYALETYGFVKQKWYDFFLHIA